MQELYTHKYVKGTCFFFSFIIYFFTFMPIYFYTKNVLHNQNHVRKDYTLHTSIYRNNIRKLKIILGKEILIQDIVSV